MSCRLYIEPEKLEVGAIAITGSDHHYLCRVRRLGPGDRVRLFDGEGREADAEITEVKKTTAMVTVATIDTSPVAAGPRIDIMLSLIKGDRTEWALQKLVELGVDGIHPVRADRSVVRLDPKRAEARHQRYLGVARDAARQCGRATVPAISPITPLADALSQIEPDPADAELRLVLWEEVRGQTLAAALSGWRGDRVTVLIGPEGSFAPHELDLARAAGFTPVGFGPRVLRAETAAVAAAAILQFALT